MCGGLNYFFSFFFFLKVVVERHFNASVGPKIQRRLPTHSPGAESLWFNLMFAFENPS